MDSYPRERQAAAMAIFGMGVVVGPVLAPTLGGYLSETYNWRWVFFMIVPFGLAALTGVLVYIQDRNRSAATHLDWTGFLALSGFIASFPSMEQPTGREDRSRT